MFVIHTDCNNVCRESIPHHTTTHIARQKYALKDYKSETNLEKSMSYTINSYICNMQTA